MLVLIYLWITISHLFVCLPTLELTTFEQHVCSSKIAYAHALSLGKKQPQKKERDLNSFFWILWTYEICSLLNQSWKNIYSRTTTKLVPLLQLTTRKWVFSTEWIRTWPSIGIRMKKWWWFPFVWIIDVAIQGTWVLHRINKDEKGDESLPPLTFRRHVVNVIFLKYSKEGRLSLSHLGIRNIASDVYYDNTKHYQVQSEQRSIQNPFKYLRGNVFA